MSHSYSCVECGHLTPINTPEPTCSIDGCNGKATSGYKDKHYCSDHMLIGLGEFVRSVFRNVKFPE